MCDIRRIYTLEFISNFFGLFEFVDVNSNKFLCIFPTFIEKFVINFFFFFIPFLFGLYHTRFILAKCNQNNQSNSNHKTETKRDTSHKPLIFDKQNYLDLFKDNMMIFLTHIIFLSVNIIYYLFSYYTDSLFKFIIYISIFLGQVNFISIKTFVKGYITLSKSTILMILMPYVNTHCIYSTMLLGWMIGLFSTDVYENGFTGLWETAEDIKKKAYGGLKNSAMQMITIKSEENSYSENANNTNKSNNNMNLNMSMSMSMSMSMDKSLTLNDSIEK